MDPIRPEELIGSPSIALGGECLEFLLVCGRFHLNDQLPAAISNRPGLARVLCAKRLAPGLMHVPVTEFLSEARTPEVTLQRLLELQGLSVPDRWFARKAQEGPLVRRRNRGGSCGSTGQ